MAKISLKTAADRTVATRPSKQELMKEIENGASAKDFLEKYGLSRPTYYNYKRRIKEAAAAEHIAEKGEATAGTVSPPAAKKEGRKEKKAEVKKENRELYHLVQQSRDELSLKVNGVHIVIEKGVKKVRIGKKSLHVDF